MNFLLILLTTLFVDANAQYAEGNYAEAAIQYEQILTEQPSAEVYCGCLKLRPPKYDK